MYEQADSTERIREEKEKAKNIAIGYLSKRTVSRKQMEEKLKERGVESQEAIDTTVQLMIDLVNAVPKGALNFD